eukprot:45790-Eustigmatos_ZCMA.PRE.1
MKPPLPPHSFRQDSVRFGLDTPLHRMGQFRPMCYISRSEDEPYTARVAIVPQVETSEDCTVDKDTL